MKFRQFILAFIWECRFQRERAAADIPWEDTPEVRQDWLDEVETELVYLLFGDDEEWRERIAPSECLTCRGQGEVDGHDMVQVGDWPDGSPAMQDFGMPEPCPDCNGRHAR